MRSCAPRRAPCPTAAVTDTSVPPRCLPKPSPQQRKRSAVIGGEPDDHREGLVPTEIIIAGMPPGILAHGRSFFHRAVEQGLAVAAAGRGGSAGRSLPLKENHDLRGADGPHTRHREAADDPPALGRIAVERMLQALWTELAAPPAVFLRQHLIFHGLSTSLKRPANGDFYGIPTRTRANVKHQIRVVRPCIIRSRGYPSNDSDASKCC